MVYINKKRLPQLKEYKYSGVDKSLVSYYVLKPFYQNVAIKFFPLSMAPNAITLTGLSFVIVNFLTLLYYNPGLDQNCPSWVYISWAVGLFLYQTFDAVDGTQARRTKQSGPLGELFDHGVDACNTFLEALLFAGATNIGHSWKTVLVLFGTLFTFYVQTWEEYHTHTLSLGTISGPVEGVLTLCFMFITTAFLEEGANYWRKPLIAAFVGDKYRGSIPDVLYDLEWCEWWMLYAGLILTYNTFSSIKAVRAARRAEGKSTAVAVLGLLPFVGTWITIPVYLYLQPQVRTTHLIAFTFYIGLINALSVGQIIVTHLVKAPFPYLQNVLIWPLFFGVLDALLLQARLTDGLFAAWQGTDIKDGDYGPAIFVYLCVGLAVGVYGAFVVDVIDTICEYLDIWCLTIKYPATHIDAESYSRFAIVFNATLGLESEGQLVAGGPRGVPLIQATPSQSKYLQRHQAGRVRTSAPILQETLFPANKNVASSLYVASSSHKDGLAGAHRSSPSPSRSTSRSLFSSKLKSKSTPHLNAMSNLASKYSPSQRSAGEDVDLNTLPDPRTPSPQSNGSRTPSNGSIHHPDLSNEVAALSTKLINAINHQTNLDDSLQSTRQELEGARERISELEKKIQEYEESIEQGLLIKRSDFDQNEARILNELEEERQRRSSAERQKKGMEQELETLTGALFEQANTMVANARKETEESEQRNEQLRSKLQDTEVLLGSQQDQLRDLKEVMSQLQTEKDQNDAAAGSTAPSTPITAPIEKLARLFDESGHARSPSTTHSSQPETPLHYTHLLHPVFRHDLQAYEEFTTLFKGRNKGSVPSSRSQSGQFSGLNVMGIGSLQNSNQSKVYSNPSLGSNQASSNQTSSASNTPGLSSLMGSPNSPSDSNGSSGTTLKENKFYKRSIAEDIEPTLRLDAAPGLSWLARRNVISSLTSGTLAVEPFPTNSRYYSHIYSCSLCGEQRNGEAYIRQHRFRTSDSEEAQRYPLCEYCLGRLRATADFVGFLRLVKNGLWRGDTQDDIKSAWEECARLREKMFWARLAGGVVPVQHDAVANSARQSRLDLHSEDAVSKDRKSSDSMPPLQRQLTEDSTSRIIAQGTQSAYAQYREARPPLPPRHSKQSSSLSKTTFPSEVSPVASQEDNIPEDSRRPESIALPPSNRASFQPGVTSPPLPSRTMTSPSLNAADNEALHDDGRESETKEDDVHLLPSPGSSGVLSHEQEVVAEPGERLATGHVAGEASEEGNPLERPEALQEPAGSEKDGDKIPGAFE